MIYNNNNFCFDGILQIPHFSRLLLPQRFHSIQYVRVEHLLQVDDKPKRFISACRLLGAMTALKKLDFSIYSKCLMSRLIPWVIEPLSQSKSLDHFTIFVHTYDVCLWDMWRQLCIESLPVGFRVNSQNYMHVGYEFCHISYAPE